MQVLTTYIFRTSTLLILLVFLGHSTWAQFPSYSARALEKFHHEQNRNLFELLPINHNDLGELLESEEKINHYERIYDRIEASIDQTLTQKAHATKQKHSLEQNIQEATERLKKWNEMMHVAQKNISNINTKLLEMSEQIDALSSNISENKEQIKKYIVLTYQNSANIFQGGEDNIDILQSLFQKNDDLATSMLERNTSKILSHIGYEMMDKNKDLIDKHYALQKETQELKDQKTMHRFRLKMLKNNVQVQIAYQGKLMDIAHKKQSILNQNHLKNRTIEDELMQEMEDLRYEYEQKIMDIKSANNCEHNDKEMCNYIDQYYKAEKKLRDEYLGRELVSFEWPVDPKYGLSATYRDVDYRHALGATHHGIDARAPQGSDIHAIADGYAIYIREPRLGNYAYLAIKHPDGYLSVYGHVSEILISRFEFVKKGQVIAKSGGAPYTPGAGNISSGPHLHFEMYHEKEVVDPLLHLDMSKIPHEHIPKKYRYKHYLDSLKNDPNTSTKRLKKSTGLLYMPGKTEIERQKHFIRTYASPVFGVWENWTRNALMGNIDPSFIMCIGFAESSMGANLTTGYNVGNVGNTDSGARREFSSPTEGIQAIVYALNGRFLGQHMHMSMLSGWGNNGGTIYASSTKNWHENMVNCLSALKGSFVDDDFEFRITEADKDKYKDELRK